MNAGRGSGDRETWLLGNPHHPDAASVTSELDNLQALWLRGYRGVLGFVYLTLGKPVATAT